MPVPPLVDSTAAALGSLFATLALYPLDLAKTRIQAGARRSAPASTWRTAYEVARVEGFLALFAGASPKAISTVASNFAFFYFFAALKALHARSSKRLTASGSLLLGTAAGALSTVVTLPTDNVTTRMQVAERTGSLSASVREAIREDGVLGLWKSFWASLALSTNPAINFAVFDMLKERALRILSARQGRTVKSLTALQSFALGSLSKAVATAITYPLIRVKVLQQAGRARRASGREGAGGAEPPARTTAVIVAELLKEDGVAGLYRGFEAQLLTTVLKSGLLLMTKEQALRVTIALLRHVQGSRAAKQG